MKSLAASEKQSLNESLILDAVASHIEALQRQQQMPGSFMHSVNQSQEGGLNPNRLNALGEEIFVDKINRIFDEVKKEADVQ